MMKSKQKSENPKQTSTEDLQSRAWKQQEFNWDLTANSQENIKSGKAGQTLTNASRKGDMAEYYAVTWLWDEGYEVYINAGSTGPVDMVAHDLETNEITLIDVKTLRGRTGDPDRVSDLGGSGRTELQKELNVRLLAFNPYTRKLSFVNHRETNEND